MNTIEQESEKIADALAKYFDQPEITKIAFTVILCEVGTNVECECRSNLSHDDLRRCLKSLIARLDQFSNQVGHA